MQAILWTFVACLTGDYQAVAEQMPWTWSDKQANVGYGLIHCFDHYELGLFTNRE